MDAPTPKKARVRIKDAPPVDKYDRKLYRWLRDVMDGSFIFTETNHTSVEYERQVINVAKELLDRYHKLLKTTEEYRNEIMIHPEFRRELYQRLFAKLMGHEYPFPFRITQTAIDRLYPVPPPYVIDSDTGLLGEHWYRHLLHSAIVAGYLKRIIAAAGRIMLHPDFDTSEVIRFLNHLHGKLLDHDVQKKEDILLRQLPYHEVSMGFQGELDRVMYNRLRDVNGLLPGVYELIYMQSFNLVVGAGYSPRFPGSEIIQRVFGGGVAGQRPWNDPATLQRVPALEYYNILNKALMEPPQTAGYFDNVRRLGCDVIYLPIYEGPRVNVDSIFRSDRVGTINIMGNDHLLLVDQRMAEAVHHGVTTEMMAPIRFPAFRPELHFTLSHVKVADNAAFIPWLAKILPNAYVDETLPGIYDRYDPKQQRVEPPTQITLSDVYIPKRDIAADENPHVLEIETSLLRPTMGQRLVQLYDDAEADLFINAENTPGVPAVIESAHDRGVAWDRIDRIEWSFNVIQPRRRR